MSQPGENSTLKEYPKITDLVTKCYQIPTDEPESDGTIAWDKTIMITVRVYCGNQLGFGYTYADLATAKFIEDHFKEIIIGKNLYDSTRLWDEMRKKSRNLGNTGVAAMAISAVDVALWDLKAKLLKLPLAHLLGLHHSKVATYGSGGFTSYSNERLKQQFERWMEEGIWMFKMKIGREKEKDIERVRFAREVIGEKNQLFVDANGAYFPKEAVKYSHIFEKYNISWLEEPVTSDNLEGLRFVKAHSPSGVNIAAGEYGYEPYYFNRMLSCEAVDVLQADASRCCGITGFLKAGILCEGYNVPFSAHTSPSIHLHPCCASVNAVHIEYFHDHERIESMFFDGFIRPVDGYLIPDFSRPGLGIDFKEKDAEKYLI